MKKLFNLLIEEEKIKRLKIFAIKKDVSASFLVERFIDELDEKNM